MARPCREGRGLLFGRLFDRLGGQGAEAEFFDDLLLERGHRLIDGIRPESLTDDDSRRASALGGID
jgi:hypothetical protein